MSDLIGQTLGAYQIEALLGAGPAGPRFAARHTRLQRVAAVRLFDADLTARPEERSRLIAGLRQAAALSHPSIVEVYDVGDVGGRLFVASELLAGGPLRSLLQRLRAERARLPLANALAIGRQAADGVAHAHRQGVAHGALSPEALRLVAPATGDGAPPAIKVDDFGLAAVFPEEVPLAYRTPEQLRGLAAGPRADVYALGVLLYELALGVPPFNVATLEQAAEKHLRARPVPPRVVRPELPAALEAVILRCLAKFPEDRFADAGELAEALRQVAAPLPAAPGQPPAPAPPRPQPAAPPPVPPLPPLDDDDPLLAGLLGTPAAGLPRPDAPTARVTPPPGPRIAVEVDQEQVGLAAGRPNFVNVRLVNRGGEADTVTLSVEGVPGAWLRDLDVPVRLGPGQASVVPVVVEPATGARGEAGDYSAVVRARSVRDQAVVGSARMRWTVLPYAAASLSIAPPWVEGGTAGDYTLTLRNEGNGPATYLLSADDRGRVLGFTIGQGELTLAPGQSARIPLGVDVERRLFGNPSEHPFTVYAEADSGDTVAAEATFIQRPLLPPWLPLLLGALLLGLIVLGLLLRPGAGQVAVATATPAPPTAIPTPVPGAPVIAAFTVSPPVVAPGQPVTLFWDVRGADRVRIDQLGDVPALGQSEFRPEQTTDFRLVANAGALETISIQRVLVAPPTATPEPSAVLSPTPLPTAIVQPTLVPPPTAVLPTVPPTAVLPTTPPPTAVPPTVPPTAVLPTAAATPAPASVSLIDLAPGAGWSTAAGPLSFGPPAPGAETGGWATLERDVALGGGAVAPVALRTVPPTAPQAQGAAAPFIEASFAVPLVQAGQFFLADVGFAQGAQSPPLRVLVTFNDEVLFEGLAQPDGRLTPLSADLSRFVGTGGRLELRVTADGGPSPAGLYWVRPRIDVPPR